MKKTMMSYLLIFYNRSTRVQEMAIIKAVDKIEAKKVSIMVMRYKTKNPSYGENDIKFLKCLDDTGYYTMNSIIYKYKANNLGYNIPILQEELEDKKVEVPTTYV